MIDFSTEEPQFTNPFIAQSEGIIPSGYFSDAELTAFSSLIDRRRPLPVYFGESWRCYSCAFECFDLFEMVNHILHAHGPEPFNEADVDEWDCAELDFGDE
jgi:hypothetical protein